MVDLIQTKPSMHSFTATSESEIVLRLSADREHLPLDPAHQIYFSPVCRTLLLRRLDYDPRRNFERAKLGAHRFQHLIRAIAKSERAITVNGLCH